MSSVEDTPWWAVRSMGGRELAVREALLGVGVEAFCPHERVTRRRAVVGRRNRFRLVTERLAVFPGYLFAMTHELSRVLDARGVIDVVRAGREALRAPAVEVERLRALSDADGLVSWRDVSKASYRYRGAKRGDAVVLATGSPLAGLRCWLGSYDRVDGQGLVDVEIEGLGRVTAVAVPDDQVERVICASTAKTSGTELVALAA